MQSDQLQRETAKVLEWTTLLEVLASYAQSTVGAEQCRSLRLESDLAQARMRERETTDMLLLKAGVDPFPLLRFPNVAEWLGRVAKGACLEVHELRDIALVLDLIHEFIDTCRGTKPSPRR